MIYLIYGSDTFRSWRKLQQIKVKYLSASQGSSDLVVLDGATLAAETFLSQIQTLPFLAKSRLVLVKNLLQESKKEVQEAVLASLGRLPSSTILFFYEAGLPDKRLKLFQALNKPKQAQLFNQLTGSEQYAYVSELANERGAPLAGNIIQQLINATLGDLWRIDQEIEKLALYCLANNKKSPVSGDIELLVAKEEEMKIFDLTDAFGSRKTVQALKILGPAADEGSGLGLLALVAGHYRNLLQIAHGQNGQMPKNVINQKLKLHPFAYDKLYLQAQRYSFKELTVVYRYLYQVDSAAKQSIIDPFLGLSVLAGLLQAPLSLPNLTEEASL